MSVGRACSASIGVSLALSLFAAQPALATFHEMMVREVYPGSAAHPGWEYVELQMWAPGQNFVSGHRVGFYDAAGIAVGTAAFTHDVSGGANQSTLLVATPEAEAEFGVEADAGLSPGLLSPVGGAVCWETLDCVSWGSFSGVTKSPVGQPATPGGIPDGMALRRTIEPGCASLLEPGDDRDDSATDFTAVFPGPRPNSVKPSEHACSSGAAAGGAAGGGPSEGGPGGSTPGRPQTLLRLRPGRRTHDRTPTFRFSSSVSGSTYACQLDGHRFQRCRSPFTTPALGFGTHVFKVRASSPDGTLDPSPASYRFAVLRGNVSGRGSLRHPGDRRRWSGR